MERDNMSKVLRQTWIQADPSDIWAILVALDQFPEWEGGYVAASYVGGQRYGVGTRRQVRLRSPMGVRKALHEITKWDENKQIAWRAVESNFPMLASAEQTVTLVPEGAGTRVDNLVEYQLSGGPVGRFMDRIMFNRVVVGANEGFVAALKKAAESLKSGD